MDDYRNGASSIRGFNSDALELNGHKCAICYSDLRELSSSVQTTCGHRFCRDCIVRYDLSDYFDIKFRRVCCLQRSDSIFSSFSFLTFFKFDFRLVKKVM